MNSYNLPKIELVSYAKLDPVKYYKHISYTFYIKNISRSCIHEHVRHRESNFSVKSSRYTLKELIQEKPFKLNWFENIVCDIKSVFGIRDKKLVELFRRGGNYLVYTGNYRVDNASLRGLENLRENIVFGISNDIAKFSLPESYKTELTWTVNAEILHNYLSLRSNKSALWEIRNVAQALYDALPEEHRKLFKDTGVDTH